MCSDRGLSEVWGQNRLTLPLSITGLKGLYGVVKFDNAYYAECVGVYAEYSDVDVKGVLGFFIKKKN